MNLLVSRSLSGSGSGKPKVVKIGKAASRKDGKTRAVKARPVKGKYKV